MNLSLVVPVSPRLPVAIVGTKRPAEPSTEQEGAPSCRQKTADPTLESDPAVIQLFQVVDISIEQMQRKQLYDVLGEFFSSMEDHQEVEITNPQKLTSIITDMGQNFNIEEFRVLTNQIKVTKLREMLNDTADEDSCDIMFDPSLLDEEKQDASERYNAFASHIITAAQEYKDSQ